LIRIMRAGAVHENVERPARKGDEAILLAKKKILEHKFLEAINLLKYLLAKTPESEEIKDLLEDAEKGFIGDIHKIFSAEAIPILNKTPDEIISQEKLTSQESFMLSRVNGLWDVKSILTITPIAELEALQILQRLAERNIIRFS